MKNISRILTVAVLASLVCSCNEFLQKPDTTGTVDQQAVFGSKKNAFSALVSCYRNALRMEIPNSGGYYHGTLGAISGEVGKGYSWHASYVLAQQGPGPTPIYTSGNREYDPDAIYGSHWANIRGCYIVKENIDQVPDMTEAEKACVKGEVTALIAFRYMGMFYRFGGVPMVDHAFNATDDMSAPRMTLQATLDHIIALCNEAYDLVPEKWDAANEGRITKGVVLAIKARALQFAARSLFNTENPYIDNGPHNDLICFGKYDEGRWQDAVNANKAVLEWADAAAVELISTGSPVGSGVANPNAFEDYATAASLPGSREVILAFKMDDTSKNDPIVSYLNCSSNTTSNYRYDTDASGVLTNFIENYYLADGSDIDWPKVGESAPRPGAEYRAIVTNLEPRALADIKWGGYDAANNPNVYSWQNAGWGRGGYNADKDKLSVFPDPISLERGCGERTKFYYLAGTRAWCEIPLFRLAENYLNLAEAYNELGQTDDALYNLNCVHNRAGLPKITERDQAKLRQIIQRETYIEFFQENRRLFNSKHWLTAGSVCGGPMRMLQFNIPDNDSATWPYAASWIEQYWDSVVYDFYWDNKMFLDPLPQSEIDKGFAVQNPGY